MGNGKVAGLFGNPFQPGYGQPPPYVAGRESERFNLFKQVGAAANRRLVARDVVIYGPRGSGKTTLLRLVEGELERLGAQVTLELMSATDMQSADDARRELIGAVGQPLWETFKPDEWGMDWRGIQAKWQRGELTRNEVRKGLVEKCKSKPLILMVDEAHMMAPAACNELLNEALTIRGRGGPLVVVFAGKPQLAALGDLAQVSFLERGELISLDLLDDQSSGDAIRIPLGRAGIGIEAEALAAVVEDCQGYPHFLQLWGAALWQRTSERDKHEIDSDDVANVAEDLNRERTEVYLGRFAAWRNKDRELLTELARRLIGGGWVDRPRLEDLVNEILAGQGRNSGDCNAIMDRIVDSDFLWRPRGQSLMLPALPSFVSFVAGQGQSDPKGLSGVSLPASQPSGSTP